MLKRSLKALCLLGILLISLLFCGAFVEKDPYAEHETLCKAMIDAVIADDREKAASLLADEVPMENFDEVYRFLRSVWADMKGYTVAVEEQGSVRENGVSYYSSVYKVTSDDGTVFRVTCTTAPGGSKLAGFHASLTDISEAPEKVPFLVQLAFILFMAACTAFAVWMVVDCIRRRIRLKGLWIVLCCLSAGFTLTLAAGNVDLMLRAGLVFFPSMATMRSSVFMLQMYFPLGAIVYFFRRKKLSAKLEQETAAFYNSQQPDFTVEVPPTVPEDLSAPQDPPKED